MIGFGYFVMKKLVFDLVDEVWEDGDSLVVKNRGQEGHISPEPTSKTSAMRR